MCKLKANVEFIHFQAQNTYLCFVLLQNQRHIPFTGAPYLSSIVNLNDGSVKCFSLVPLLLLLLVLLLNSLSIVHRTRDKQITNQNQMGCIAHNFLFLSISRSHSGCIMQRICNQQILYSENHNEINSDKIYAVNATEDELQ